MAVAGKAPNKNQQGVEWPRGRGTTLLMNGNHEMLSGGTGLFQNGFAYSGQKTTYGVWQSDSWRVVALDTGAESYPTMPGGPRNIAMTSDAPQPEALVAWLRDVVRLGDPEDKRGIVLLSHHQPYDAWVGVYLGCAKQLNDIIPAGRTVVWLFGHEHYFAIYKKMQVEEDGFRTNFTMYPRLVGHGGYPIDMMGAPKRPEGVVAYDERLYQKIPTGSLAGDFRSGFHGYFKMEVSGPTLNVSYVSAKCKASGCDHGYDEKKGDVVARESYSVDLATGELAHSFDFFDKGLTLVGNPKLGRIKEKVVRATTKESPHGDCPKYQAGGSPQEFLCDINQTLGGALTL